MNLNTALRVFVIISLVVLLIVLTVVLGIVWTMPSVSSFDRRVLCLSSTGCGRSEDVLEMYLKSRVQDHFDVIKTEENQNRKQSVNDDNFQPKNTKGNLDLRPSAKFECSLNSDDDEGVVNATVLWKSGYELRYTNGFQRCGIEYEDGRILVPLSGTYFVYSFVLFYEQHGKEDTSRTDDSVVHEIYKFNVMKTNPEKLAMSSRPRAKPYNKMFSYYNSYIETLVDLNAGDEVFVKVSDASWLQYPSDNYVGINLIA